MKENNQQTVYLEKEYYLFIIFYYLIDESVFESFFHGHKIVSVTICFDFFKRLSSMMCEEFVESLSGFYDVIGSEFDVGGLSFGSSQWLMNHDFRVWKCVSFPFGSSSENNTSHRSCESHAYRYDVALYVLHDVVNGESSGHVSARRIDVESNRSFWILFFEKKKLSNHGICHMRIDSIAQKDDTILKKSRVNIVCTFRTRNLVDNGWDEKIRRKNVFFC